MSAEQFHIRGACEQNGASTHLKSEWKGAHMPFVLFPEVFLRQRKTHHSLTAEKDRKYTEMRAMLEEIKAAEQLKKTAERLAREQNTKTHDPER